MHAPKIFSFRRAQQWHESCCNQTRESTANKTCHSISCPRKLFHPKLPNHVQTYSVAIVYISWRVLAMTCIYRYFLYCCTRDTICKIYVFQRFYSLNHSGEFSKKMSSTVSKIQLNNSLAILLVQTTAECRINVQVDFILLCRWSEVCTC